MASIKKVLKTHAGVVLTEVNLTTPRGVVLATAWEVSSKRTPEVRGSHSIEAAERHFAEELARCGSPPARS